MTQRLNPVAWLVWAGAASLLVVSTRNPLLLATCGVAILIVYLSLEHGSSARAAWATVLRIGLVVALLSIVFNLATVHIGDHVIAHIPAVLPIVGGPITLNALLYGCSSAAALLNLMLIAATFSAAVDRASLLRLVPARFAAVGVAAIVALSIFPQTLRAVRDVRAAQAARGFRVRSVRDVPPLIVPVLHLGLEHAFDLAETMESRAFGAQIGTTEAPRLPLGVGLVALAGGVVSFALGEFSAALACWGLSVIMLALVMRRGGGESRSRYRALRWQASDIAEVILAVASGGLITTALLTSTTLSFTPYPRLTWPSFALGPGIAALLLVAPALLGEGRAKV